MPGSSALKVDLDNLRWTGANEEQKLDVRPPFDKTSDNPVEFVVDTADAPELKDWAEKTAHACERAYPMINEELRSDGFTPPRLVRMALKKSYNGVAAASGSRITGSVKYFADHPDDVGAMVHETGRVRHCLSACRRRRREPPLPGREPT